MPEQIIQQLVESFMRFPGIGPRQARRFVYYLLHSPASISSQLTKQIEQLRRETSQCQRCYRYFSRSDQARQPLCNICADDTRDASLLMLVEKDTDLDNVQKSGSYQGYFFVLGGLVKILDKTPQHSIRVRELKKSIEERVKTGALREIIVALSANLEGDTTADYLKTELAPLLGTSIRFSTLGRGLSTGVELEYSDAETIKNALKNRQ